MVVVALRSFGRSLTFGNKYKVIKELDGNYIIIDDEGSELGFYKTWFKQAAPELKLEMVAQALVCLAMFSKDNSINIAQAKETSKIAVLAALNDSTDPNMIDSLNQVLIMIDNVSM